MQKRTASRLCRRLELNADQIDGAAWAVPELITPKDANYWESKLGKTTEVGAYPPNAWGLYDSYKGAPTDGTAWVDGEGDNSSRIRVIRGGSWGSDPWVLRSAVGSGVEPVGRVSNLGFRVARAQLRSTAKWPWV